jgi:acyl-CoA dehydrogenase
MPGYPSFRDPNIKAQCVARLKGDEYVINGQKSAWVSGGTIAKSVLLMCQIDPSMGHAGSGVFIFSLDRPGVSKGKPLDKIGTRDLNQGEVFFDDVTCPRNHYLWGPKVMRPHWKGS